MHRPARYIIELPTFEGTTTAGHVINEGRRYAYCIGAIASDGVMRIIDWGYQSVAEARAAWPDALHPDWATDHA